jgi:hypothetical protein
MSNVDEKSAPIETNNEDEDVDGKKMKMNDKNATDASTFDMFAADSELPVEVRWSVA